MIGDGAVALAHAAAICDGLVASGIQHLVFCPGSRSASVALAAEANPELRLWRHLDERSAAFFALGIAKATRHPVALLCTSGTAAANFYPAIIEAKYARVPLVILTADRPHELREVGAPQAIDQVHLFGRHVKAAFDLALPEYSAKMRHVARTTVIRASALAAALPAGPVHLNLPFREPLFPPGGAAAITDTLTEASAITGQGRGPTVVGGVPALSHEALEAMVAQALPGQRGLIVCGPQDDPALPGAISQLAQTLGYPILADPLSGLRCGGHDRGLVIDTYDALLRVEGWVEQVRPEIILRFGAMPTSKAFRQYMEFGEGEGQITHWVIDPGGEWLDPIYQATDVIHADPVALCHQWVGWLAEQQAEAEGQVKAGHPAGYSAGHDTLHSEPVVSTWCQLWLSANRKLRETLEREIASLTEPFEGSPYPLLADNLPANATLFVGNSMPIRDLDTFFSGRDEPLRVMGNRGANGIDGLISTGLGVAAGTGQPVVLIVGDLSFYHDLNGLLAAKQYDLDVTVLLINNDGGGIFSFLPQAALEDSFEHLFGTPHGLDFAPVVKMYGGKYTTIAEPAVLPTALQNALNSDGLHVLELRTERRANVTLHEHMWQVVEAVVAEILAGADGGGHSACTSKSME